MISLQSDKNDVIKVNLNPKNTNMKNEFVVR